MTCKLHRWPEVCFRGRLCRAMLRRLNVGTVARLRRCVALLLGPCLRKNAQAGWIPTGGVDYFKRGVACST
eukprot:13080969-Alexandrium_andersonii.AAC.1